MTMNYPYEDFLDLFFSTNTDTLATAASTSSCGYSLNDLDIDWDCDFRDVIESIMGDEGAMMEPESESVPMLHGQEGLCNSASTSLSVADGVSVEEPKTDESKGLRLVHLLVAAAEASTGANKSRELTRVILARLKDLVSPADRTNMERLAAHFTNGLSKLLERENFMRPQQHRDDVYDQADVISAFELLQNMSPYVNFGYLTATQAILEAVKYERRIHIVDYDITEGVQWASLMQALVSKNTGPSAQHLRITALSRAINGKKSIAAVQETGRRLTAFAESIGQPFSYHHCKLDTNAFSTSSLKLVRGEAVVINCMLHLPRFSNQTPNSVISFLSEAKTLNPKLVTLVHEEVGLMGNQGFLYRFMDLLHQFSAIFDSLEAGLSIANPARGFVERVFIGPWVANWLTRITADDAEVESFASWPQWLETNGFKPMEVSFANRCQAKLLLSLFNDGYIVEELGQNGLVLGWKSRRLVSASFWVSRELNQ
ncbi:Transcription factor GRAS [Arabidopsis thaliana x Arabidopsis arenosa]|uniref:Transcription factor GRAS n=1 Tax=Arabidopsis thaliana x Arabidopsis arenosa TaxID=1240361 RepID=A0A8T1Z0S7_9BRAS|nr:Transcription factor GRAS [Arabidopsis thaliana x Arabidopsis arenosa]